MWLLSSVIIKSSNWKPPLMYYSAFILWIYHFLDSGAEICQIFRWIFGKFKSIKKTFWNHLNFRRSKCQNYKEELCSWGDIMPKCLRGWLLWWEIIPEGVLVKLSKRDKILGGRVCVSQMSFKKLRFWNSNLRKLWREIENLEAYLLAWPAL